ncbi:MAG: aminodeoxychorismate/anthranilate synthase component II [Candidatus Delongbacteria bacterium]|nr:aminodeoxychorismate/anthranilate synthase component II [Candidatus Delongbacteria bacterium]
MKTILLFDNYDSFTYNLYDLLKTVKPDYKIIVKRNKDRELFDIDFDMLVISPGPMTWEETGLLRELFKKKIIPEKIPTLGICLGMQFIAGYYGMSVAEVKEPAHGSQVKIIHSNDSLFNNIPIEFKAVRYNSLGIKKENTANNNIQYIAAEKGTGAIMALKHSTLPFVGLQYHPESFLSEYGKETINNFFEIYVEN